MILWPMIEHRIDRRDPIGIRNRNRFAPETMKVLVILSHPRLDCFCHKIAEAAIVEFREAGHEVVFHDLYAENFDAILPHSEVLKSAKPDAAIEQHCRELVDADLYVIVHPIWWAMPPAMLKGWVDRVFRPGIAYEFSPQGAVGKLKGKRAIVFTTSNSPPEEDGNGSGSPLEELWKRSIFGFCGVDDFYCRNFASIVLSTQEQRDEWVREVRTIARNR